MAKKQSREWISLSDQKPTAKDADKQGRVLWRRVGEKWQIKGVWHAGGHQEWEWSPLARKKSNSRTGQRSLAWCRAQGWEVQITERWNSFARIRQDLFGFIDLLALDVLSQTIIGIQTTVGSSMANRIDKIKAERRAIAFAQCGGLIMVHGWRQVAAHKKDGTRAARDKWALRVAKLQWCDDEWQVTEKESE